MAESNQDWVFIHVSFEDFEFYLQLDLMFPFVAKGDSVFNVECGPGVLLEVVEILS